MVQAVRAGESQRAVARRFGKGLATVQLWVARAEGQRLDRVDWSDQPSSPRRIQRTSKRDEERVLRARRYLHDHSALGEFGAVAIHRYLSERYGEAPSVRTIGRILKRRGALDGKVRVRRPPPPVGWYLPRVARRQVELDSFDVVSGLVIKNGPAVEVLNGVSLHGGLVASWPATAITAKRVVEALIEHWRRVGLPGYVQFDNDTRFQGAHHHKDSVGRVSRLCLSLGISPVFAPPRETGFQAAIESYNGRWQAKVWARFHHSSLRALQSRSAAYVQASHARHHSRAETAPPRQAFPRSWLGLDLQAFPHGVLTYLRRTDARGYAALLGHRFFVSRTWPHRLVRAEVNLSAKRIRFFSLRRRDPADQQLLRTARYDWPHKPFRDRSS